MSDTSASDRSDPQFVKAFIPGLLLGLVVGLPVGAVLPPLLNPRPKVPTPVKTSAERPPVTDTRDVRDPAPSEQDVTDAVEDATSTIDDATPNGGG